MGVGGHPDHLGHRQQGAAAGDRPPRRGLQLLQGGRDDGRDGAVRPVPPVRPAVRGGSGCPARGRPARRKAARMVAIAASAGLASILRTLVRVTDNSCRFVTPETKVAQGIQRPTSTSKCSPAARTTDSPKRVGRSEYTTAPSNGSPTPTRHRSNPREHPPPPRPHPQRPRPRNRVDRRRRLVAAKPARTLGGVHAIGQAVLVGAANRNDPDGVGVLGSIEGVRREIDVKLTMTRLAFLAVGAIAPLIVFAPSASAMGVPCPYVTSAPVAQCQSDDGLPGLGNGPSPFEYPVGFPGSL